MEEVKVIRATTEDGLWQEVAKGIDRDENVLGYKTLLVLNGKEIALEFDIDPGGGFESGYEYTRLSAVVKEESTFKFAMHSQHFMDTIGKFFGMEDIEIGYPEFDKRFIIKTNDPARAKIIFSDGSLRQAIQSIDDFTIHISHRKVGKERESFIELETQTAIMDIPVLRKMYSIVSRMVDTIIAMHA